MITKLTNSGMMSGGGGAGNFRPGEAILSAGANASIGSIINSGSVVGNVEFDNQAGVTIIGGTGKTFGSLTGGTITIGNGNLTFTSANTALGDNIEVNGDKGTVTNKASLRLAAPENIGGNFTPASAAVLGMDFAADSRGQSGELRVYRLATLDGGLAIDLTGGFTLATGDDFDMMTFGRVAGNFSSLSRQRRVQDAFDRRLVMLEPRRPHYRRGLRKEFADPRRRERRRGNRPQQNGFPQSRRSELRRARALDLGDARDGLPRPRRLGPQEAHDDYHCYE